MASLTKQGDSIEGLKIAGQSRDPLINRGLYIYKEVRCFRFVADFDVKANIVKELNKKTKKIDSEAHLLLDDEIICSGALIHSLNDKYSNSLEHVSAKHRANVWRFTKQSNVAVTKSHEEINNAKQKSALSNAATAVSSETRP